MTKPITDSPNTDSSVKRERCQRLLARLGDKRITTADKANYFTPEARAEAERRCQQAKADFWANDVDGT